MKQPSEDETFAIQNGLTTIVYVRFKVSEIERINAEIKRAWDEDSRNQTRSGFIREAVKRRLDEIEASCQEVPKEG